MAAEALPPRWGGKYLLRADIYALMGVAVCFILPAILNVLSSKTEDNALVTPCIHSMMYAGNGGRRRRSDAAKVYLFFEKAVPFRFLFVQIVCMGGV